MYPCEHMSTVQTCGQTYSHMRCVNYKFVSCENLSIYAGDTIDSTDQTKWVIYQTDKYGNVQYHRPSQLVDGNVIYQVDKYGNVQYHRDSKVITD